MLDVEKALEGTPYLIATDSESSARFEALLQVAQQTRERAVQTNKRIRAEAAELLEPYLRATRTDLVAQSNEMEYMPWTATAAREIVLKNRELLDGPTRTLVESVRADPRVYQVLGLYRAHQLAEDWAASDRTPFASDIRALHSLILGAVRGSGEYKQFSNGIGGTKHRTVETFDVARVMIELCDWWARGAQDPVLSATVVHAWLAHIHPFDDGNGRTARVLANLELARNGYPPLIVRPGADRGQYYDALAASDEGDILPLYALFVHAVRRQVRLMARPNYILDLIEDRFLATDMDRYRYWSDTLRAFTEDLRSELAHRGAGFRVMGMLEDPASFQLLVERDPEGNGWFAKVGRPGRDAEWLLWFGYRSDQLMQVEPQDRAYPSIFISRRERDPQAVHPYTPDFARSEIPIPLPDEISLLPMVAEPVCLRRGFSTEVYKLKSGARMLAEAMCSSM